MAATKDRALQAAIELLGTEGVRALTHTRVDAAAGLPAGSTSNWFRTRRALIAGVVDRIAENERADFVPVLPQPVTPGAIVEGFVAVLHRQTGPLAARTRARYALFLELTDDTDMLAPLRQQRYQFEQFTDQLVAEAGIPDPVTAARALMALADGLLLHRLTVDPELDLRAPLELVIGALSRS